MTTPKTNLLSICGLTYKEAIPALEYCGLGNGNVIGNSKCTATCQCIVCRSDTRNSHCTSVTRIAGHSSVHIRFDGFFTVGCFKEPCGMGAAVQRHSDTTTHCGKFRFGEFIPRNIQLYLDLNAILFIVGRVGIDSYISNGARNRSIRCPTILQQAIKFSDDHRSRIVLSCKGAESSERTKQAYCQKNGHHFFHVLFHNRSSFRRGGTDRSVLHNLIVLLILHLLQQ